MDTRWTVVEKSDKENSLLRRTLAESWEIKRTMAEKKREERRWKEKMEYKTTGKIRKAK